MRKTGSPRSSSVLARGAPSIWLATPFYFLFAAFNRPVAPARPAHPRQDDRVAMHGRAGHDARFR